MDESNCRDQLKAYDITPKRSLGQNFLADRGLCTRIAELSGSANVLEIGAGMGALTAPLLAQGCRVTAVETDRRLVEVLRERFREATSTSQLRIVEADAREAPLGELLSELAEPRVLSGNLPYHLSGLLLRRAVELAPLVGQCVFLLQHEVVSRLCAEAGSEDYGALSVFAQAVYAPHRALVVRRGAFYPQPGVDSAVVVLARRGRPVAEPHGLFADLVHRAFEQRRKTLRNAWRTVAGEAQLIDGARAAGIDLGARGETLTVQQFGEMAQALASFAPAPR